MALKTDLHKDYLQESTSQSHNKESTTPGSTSKTLQGDTYCRFCAKKATYSDLLDLSKDISTHEKYIEILEFFKVDYIDLSENSQLPCTTCLSCYYAIQNSYTFFKRAKESQKILINMSLGIKCENVEDGSNDELEEETVHIFSDGKLEESTIRVFQVELSVEPDVEKTDTIVNFPNEDPPLMQVEMKVLDEPIALEPSSSPKRRQRPRRQAKKIKQEVIDCSDDDEPLIRKRKTDYSWTSYTWYCVHCRKKFQDMEELRYHSKEEHNKCYGFYCVDCRDEFNQFNAFIEHVRQHRDVLRYFCAFCNMKFKNPSECNDHSLQHWLGTEKICEMCGEVFPDITALKQHKKVYKRRRLPRRAYAKKPKVVHPCSLNASWTSYTWWCQDCNAKYGTADELRHHVRVVHEKCFAIRCADCLKMMINFRIFVEHAYKHRPYLRKYCQYCGGYYSDQKELSSHVEEHLTGGRRPCEGCGQIFEDNSQMQLHMMQYESPRSHKNPTEEDLKCDLCGKVFTNIMAIRRHRDIHNERARDHTCEECGRAFYDKHLLAGHLKTHNPEPVMCLICKRIFKNPRQLKDHVKIHKPVQTFSCEQCGKIFQKKKILECHLMTHTGEMPFKCSVCKKRFRLKSNLKTHMHQHTGEKPYPCKVCDKAFTNWANCNKHMIRIHGIPLAKTKRTEMGTVAIDAATGQPVEMEFDENARIWMEKVLESKLKRKAPKEIVDNSKSN